MADRRSFLAVCGSCLLGAKSNILSRYNRPAVALEFSLNGGTLTKNPSKVSSVLIEFSEFNLRRKYLDESKDLMVKISLDLEGREKVQSQTSINLDNNKYINKETVDSITPIIVDGIDTDKSSLSGEITIRIEHPDILNNTKYKRSFRISESSIPDNKIYLQDDWGDNRLDSRKGSGTTVHNGVEGIYRPNWTVSSGTPTVSNENVVMQGQSTDQAIQSEHNIDMNSSITWECTLACRTPNGGRAGIDIGSNGNLRYGIAEDVTGTMYLYDIDRGTRIIQGNINNDGSKETIKIKRSSSGFWELFYGDNRLGGTNEDKGVALDTVRLSNRTNSAEAKFENIKIS